MNIKSISKKFLASLLVTTVFIPLGFKINDVIQKNYFTTFANNTSTVVNHENVDFISVGNNTYIEKTLYEQSPNDYNSKAISQVLGCANKLVNEKIGLKYNLSVPIYVVDNDSTKFLKKSEAAICHKKGSAMINSKENEQDIYIKNKHFFKNGTDTLAHEMIHAIIHDKLKKDLPRWIDEGFATQADPQKCYGENFTKDELNKLFKKEKYPENKDENLKYYLIHQRLVKFLIEDRGINVINEFINLVNNGKSPEDAFYCLGGDNAINKLKSVASN